MKKNNVKKWIVLAGSVLMSMCFVAGASLLSHEKNTVAVNAEAAAQTETTVEAKPIDQVSVSMKAGATVRLQDYIKDEQGNGLTWTLQMSKDDYLSLKEYYDRIVFGVLIAPNERHRITPISYESVFGENPAYGYMLGETKYNEGCYQILNLRTGGLAESSDGSCTFRASMVNIKPTNASREFIGVGYVKCIAEDGTATWKFLEENDNVRSVASLAQEMQASGNYNAYNDVFNGYMDNVGSLIAGYSTGSAMSIRHDAELPRSILGYDILTNNYKYYGYMKVVNETVGGVTGKYLHYQNDDSVFAIVLRPTYEKAYYQQLLATYPGAYVSFNTYTDAIGSTANYVLGKGYSDPKFEMNVWQRQELALEKYIGYYDNMCQTNKFNWGQLFTEAALVAMDWNGVTTPSNLYIDELSLYINQPLTTATQLNAVCGGEALNLYDALSLDGNYEYFLADGTNISKLQNGEIAALETAGMKKIYVAKILENGVKEFVNTVEITYTALQTATEWASEFNAMDKVTDFTKGEYVTPYPYNTSLTLFQQNNHKDNLWMNSSNPTIETQTIDGGVSNVAKFTPNQASTSRMYLPDTIGGDALKMAQSAGYTLKVKVYIDEGNATPVERTVYSLQYDEGTNAFVAIGSSTRTTTVKTETWTEVEIDINDYIRLMEKIGDNNGTRVAGTTDQCVLAFNVGKACSLYVSEIYFGMPTASETVSATANGTVDMVSYIPEDGNTYECYTYVNGVLTAVDGTTVAVGTQAFDVVIVKATVENGAMVRKVVKTVGVSVV